MTRPVVITAVIVALAAATAAGAGIPALIALLSLAVTREAWARTHRS